MFVICTYSIHNHPYGTGPVTILVDMTPIIANICDVITVRRSGMYCKHFTIDRILDCCHITNHRTRIGKYFFEVKRCNTYSQNFYSISEIVSLFEVISDARGISAAWEVRGRCWGLGGCWGILRKCSNYFCIGFAVLSLYVFESHRFEILSTSCKFTCCKNYSSAV